MPRTPARYRQADIQRALRAIKAEDINMSVDLRPDGTIRITPVELPERLAANNSPGKPRIEL